MLGSSSDSTSNFSPFIRTMMCDSSIICKWNLLEFCFRYFYAHAMHFLLWTMFKGGLKNKFMFLVTSHKILNLILLDIGSMSVFCVVLGFSIKETEILLYLSSSLAKFRRVSPSAKTATILCNHSFLGSKIHNYLLL